MKHLNVVRTLLSLPLLTVFCGMASAEETATEPEASTEGLPYLGHYVRSSINPIDVYGFFRTMDGDIEAGGVTAIEDSGWVGGAGFAVQFSRFASGYSELGFGRLDSQIPGGPSFDTDVLDWNLGVDFTLLRRRITPVISPEIGVMRHAGDITGTGSYFREWVFTYGVGAGARWDITDRWFATALYRVEWTNFQDASSSTLYRGFLGRIGYKF